MNKMNEISVPSLVCTGSALTTTLNGTVTRIMDNENLSTSTFAIQDFNAAEYCGQMSPTAKPVRNGLLQSALSYGLPVAVTGDANGNITGASVGSITGPAPSFLCSPIQFSSANVTGYPIRIMDQDLSSLSSYVVRSVDGTPHCANMDALAQANKHALLLTALQNTLPVNVLSDGNGTITAVSLGYKFYGPPLNIPTPLVSTTQSGIVVEIIDNDASSNVVYVIQASNNFQYWAQIARGANANRNALLTMALRSMLPVTISTDTNSMATGVAVSQVNTPAPMLTCTGQAMTSSGLIGNLLTIMDVDGSSNYVYQIQDSTGKNYCAPQSKSQSNRNGLLMLALENERMVGLTSDSSGNITGVVVSSATTTPSFVCGPLPLNLTESGVISRIMDLNGWTDGNYVLVGADQASYCMQSAISSHVSRDNLLKIALIRGFGVTATPIRADSYHWIMALAVGT